MVGLRIRPVFTDGGGGTSDSSHHFILTVFEIEERPENWSSRPDIAICG